MRWSFGENEIFLSVNMRWSFGELEVFLSVDMRWSFGEYEVVIRKIRVSVRKWLHSFAKSEPHGRCFITYRIDARQIYQPT